MNKQNSQMAKQKNPSSEGIDISKEQLTAALQNAQAWVKEHKVLTTLAAAAVLYFVGGKRLRGLLGLALKSGATAGIANAAFTSVIPSSKPAISAETESMLH